MSAPAVNPVAWYTGRGGFSLWHLEYTAQQGRTLCMRPVGAFRVSRVRHGEAETCAGCVKVLEYETRKRLGLDPRPAA